MSVSTINNFNFTTNNTTDFSTDLKQYISRVKQATAYSLWIRDTYSTSGYKQPLIAQPTIISQRQAKDAPFNSTDLEVYPDNYLGEIPINGIKDAEYQKIKTLYENIIQGRSTITFDPKLPVKLRQLLEMDLILLLTRPTSRQLLFTLSQRQVPLKLIEGDAFQYFRFTQEVRVEGAEMPSHICRERSDGENQFFSPSPHFISLAHEFTHALFDHVNGFKSVVKLASSTPTLCEELDNLSEQLTITGDAGGKAENSAIHEQQMCREFGIPYREDHRFGGPFSPDADAGLSIPDEQLTPSYSNFDGGTFKEGQFPIRWAARFGATLNVVHWLKTGGDVNLKFKGGRTLLHEAANGGNYKIATLLMDRGANIQAIDDQGRSILHECANDSPNEVNKSRTEIGKLLLNKGLPIDLKNSQGFTPIQLAYKSNSKFASILFDYGANVQGISLSDAIGESDNEFVRRLFESGASINRYTGDSLFKDCLEKKKYDLAFLLLKTGVDINYQEISPYGVVVGRTILHNEVIYCRAQRSIDLNEGIKEDAQGSKTRTEKVRFLLDNGANPSSADAYGDSPFHTAYSNRDLAVLSLLHEKDPKGHLIKPRFKESVYELAQKENWKEALDLFAQKNANDDVVKLPISPEKYHCKTPLAFLSQSLRKGESKGIIKSIFLRLAAHEQNAIYKAVNQEVKNPHSSDLKYGEDHAFDEMPVFKTAVEKVIWAKLEQLTQEEKNRIYRRIYELAGEPQDVSLCWGEEHAKENLPLLADALIPKGRV